MFVFVMLFEVIHNNVEYKVLLFCFYAGFVVPVVIHYNVVTGEFMHIVPTMDRREVTRTFDLTPLRIEVFFLSLWCLEEVV